MPHLQSPHIVLTAIRNLEANSHDIKEQERQMSSIDDHQMQLPLFALKEGLIVWNVLDPFDGELLFQSHKLVLNLKGREYVFMIFKTQMFHVGLLHETMKNGLGKDRKKNLCLALVVHFNTRF